MEKERENKIVGILNRGKNNTFIDNTFVGLDVGIQDEGEDTFASGNKFADRLPSKSFDNKFNNSPVVNKWSSFSMDNPIVYIVVFILLAAIAYAAYRFGLPLKFASN